MAAPTMKGSNFTSLAGSASADVVVRILTVMENKGLKLVEKDIKALENRFKQATIQSKRFRFEFLGVLFAGMALQRAFGGLREATTKTFMEISDAAGNVTTNLNAIGAEADFLKFQVGQAIDKFLGVVKPALDPILDFASDFIQRNPELVGGFILLGEGIGKILSVVGQASLGLLSILRVLEELGVGGAGGVSARAAAGLLTIKSALGEMLLLLGGPLGIVALLAAVVGYFLFKEANKLKEEIDKTSDSIDKLNKGLALTKSELNDLQRFLGPNVPLTAGPTLPATEEFNREQINRILREIGVTPVVQTPTRQPNVGFGFEGVKGNITYVNASNATFTFTSPISSSTDIENMFSDLSTKANREVGFATQFGD